jgi:hypothetical protein
MTSRTTTRLRRGVSVMGAAVVAVASFALPASADVTETSSSSAAARRSVERTGECRNGAAEWDLKVQTRPRGRLYVELEVDEIARGSRWQMFLADNGRRVAAVTRVGGVAREVRVNRVILNRRGRDRVRAAAVNPRSGSTCVGRLRF